MQERSLGMKDEGMSRENCKPGHVTLPLKAPQGLPYHLRVKAEVLTMTQEALSDLTWGLLYLLLPLLQPHLPPCSSSGPSCSKFSKESFFPHIHLVCTLLLLPSGLYSDITFPVRSSLPPFPDTLYPPPCLIFSVSITASQHWIYLAYLHLLSVSSKKNNSSCGQEFLSTGSCCTLGAWQYLAYCRCSINICGMTAERVIKEDYAKLRLLGFIWKVKGSCGCF